MLRWWEEQYLRNHAGLRAAGALFVCTTARPSTNGHLHLGHALNKSSRTSPSSPQHSGAAVHVCLPAGTISVEIYLAKEKEMPPYAVRAAAASTRTSSSISSKEFKRLGVLGDWEHPWSCSRIRTATATELANFVEKGNEGPQQKPIYWCCSCQTALAEAEVEYADHKSPSILRPLPVDRRQAQDGFRERRPVPRLCDHLDHDPVDPASNMAVALHPEFEYSLVEYEGSQYVLATELVESVAKACGWDMDGVKIVGTATGQQRNSSGRHPFYDRESPLILGGHVTLDAVPAASIPLPDTAARTEVCLQYGIDIYSRSTIAANTSTAWSFRRIAGAEPTPMSLRRSRKSAT